MSLSKKDIEAFRVQLEELKKEHTRTLDGTSSNVMTPDDSKGASQHHADAGTDDFGRTISIEVSTKELNVIKQIDRAIEKIDEGTYGICDVSGEKIPEKRLKAIPYATMTIGAQEMLEKGQI